MFAQLFGYYLLNKNIITAQQLYEVLANKNAAKARLGSMFTDAGYMTAEQVEYIHQEQKHFDKKMGDIAVFLGFLTQDQVKELLAKQSHDDTVLADVLIDKGYITEIEYENLLKAYQQEMGIDGEINEKNLAKDIISIFSLESLPDKDIYADYISLFVRNAIRFIGDDFAFSCIDAKESFSEGCRVSQVIRGKNISINTSIFGEKEVMASFAARYSSKNESACSYSDVGEFLDLQNALYASNKFALDSSKYILEEQTFSEKFMFDNNQQEIVIPLLFIFGNIYIQIYLNKTDKDNKV